MAKNPCVTIPTEFIKNLQLQGKGRLQRVDDIVFQRFNPEDVEDAVALAKLSPREGAGSCEADRDLVQPIPYALVLAKDTGKVLIYKRGEVVGEGRLVNMYSAGFGGHAEQLSSTISGTMLDTLKRELTEELGIPENLPSLKISEPLVFYASNNEVGSRHLCYAYVVKVNSADIDLSLVETGIDNPQWMDMERVGRPYCPTPAEYEAIKLADEQVEQRGWEDWSKLLLPVVRSIC